MNTRWYRKLAAFALAIVGLGVLAGPAVADTKICAGDKALYCHSEDAGEGRIYKCLAKNRAKLNDDCGALVDGVEESLGAAKGVCRDDAYAYCTDETVGVGETMAESDSGQLMQTGAGRVLKCLSANEKKLSAACKAQVADLMRTFQSKSQ